MSFLRFAMLFSLAVWLGGLIFFPVVAQTAFSVLPSQPLAGLVVRGSLIKLHWMGMISSVVFVASSSISSRMAEGRLTAFRASHMLIAGMLALTAISQFRIIPRMEALRTAVGEISALPAGDPARVQFDFLHVWSTRLEEMVLLLGLIALYLTARRFGVSRT